MNLMMMIRRILTERAGDDIPAGGGGGSSATPDGPARSVEDSSEFFADLASGDDAPSSPAAGPGNNGAAPAASGQPQPGAPAAAHAPAVNPAASTPSPAPAAPSPAAASPAPAQPAAPAQPQPQATPQPQAGAQPAVPVPGATPDPAAPAAASGEQLTFEQHREKFLPELRKLYELTPEMVEKIRTAPEEVLPDLAARLHYETQLAVYNSVMSVIPQVTQLVLESREAHTKANDAFYTAWPKLKELVAKDPTKEEAIRQSIRAFRHANPKADQATVIQQAGLLAAMTLGIPLDIPGAQPAAQAVPGAPAANPAAPAPAPTPVRPPGIGAVGHVPHAPAPGTGADDGNIFEDLADFHLRGG